MVKVGFIQNWQTDVVWFVMLPFIAVASALASREWLPAVTLASIALWITVPHHFATWYRTFGLSDDWQRWKERLLVGPLVILGLTMLGLNFAPLTMLMVVWLWDHQHSLMQQHGIARIYDFKAKTGTALTAKMDLLLHWTLYGNLVLTSPMTTKVWVLQLYRWHLPISIDVVRAIHVVSYTVLAGYLCAYVVHLILCMRSGYSLNPIKYVFIGSSYFLWYYTAWHTESVLVFGIAHRLMHGLQYFAIVHFYMRRMTVRARDPRSFWARRLGVGGVTSLVGLSVIYLFVYRAITNLPVESLGFGLIDFNLVIDIFPTFGLQALKSQIGYDLFAAAAVESVALTHYYYDSFIWKVSDSKTQEGL